MAIVARVARDIQTDLNRIGVMLTAARATDNQDTLDILIQVETRFESELGQLTRDSKTMRQASIDAADTELIAFEREANVSRELKAAIALSRGDLVNRRKGV